LNNNDSATIQTFRRGLVSAVFLNKEIESDGICRLWTAGVNWCSGGLIWKLLRGRGDGNENVCYKYAHLYPLTCTWYVWKLSKSLQT